jgi:hypothetical protein
METIKISGTCQGFRVQYERTFPNPEEEFPDLADIVGFLVEKGMEKPVVAAPAAAGAVAKQPAVQWSCSVHGTAKVGPGYQGRGKRCTFTVFDAEPEWPSRAWETRDETTAYTCTEKSR